MPISAAVLSKRSPLDNTRTPSARDVEIVVHINEALGEDGRRQMKAAVAQVPGVKTVNFNTNQLMLVAYDPQITTSFNILKGLRRQRLPTQPLVPVEP